MILISKIVLCLIELGDKDENGNGSTSIVRRPHAKVMRNVTAKIGW